MEQREIGRLARRVSVVGLGTWQLGADWGEVAPQDATATLEAAWEEGVTFFDTADVYGDGRSEQFVGAFQHRHPEVFVATKMGRRAEQLTENYNRDAFLEWNDRSRRNLGTERLDLVQLHCPPDGVFESDAVFGALDEMVDAGRIAAYGVSVETCAQALRAMERPGVATVQIILNCFRLKPLEEVLPAAAAAGVGIIARVPLASGLLSGRYDENTTFAAGDHRSYNRHGEAFDVGETFSGVPFEVGVRAARELREVAGDVPLAQFALRWVIDQPGVSTVIPGARDPGQARANAQASRLAPLRDEQQDAVREVYDRLIRTHVHDRW
jgi:aryl-alcohol dehydrogenase-like predicted oxidoreductase